MYRVLLVDDEHPALSYMDAIIRKYLPHFEVAATVENASAAWNILTKQVIDVLITDISMPGEMNGIDLAKKARANFPSLPIIIVSGYSEFEYARGALQAGVEDYLLKPISISKVKEVMAKVEEQLDQSQIDLIEKTFTDLITQKELSPRLLERCFGNYTYYYAVVRFGNLTNSRFSKIYSTGRCALQQPNWVAFYGRDEDELILLLPTIYGNGRFSVMLKELLDNLSDGRCYTAVYNVDRTPIRMINKFLSKAYDTINNCLIIGRSQCLMAGTQATNHTDALPGSTRKQITSLTIGNCWEKLKELFLTLAVNWERAAIPQAQLETLCLRIVHLVVDEASPAHALPIPDLNVELAALFTSASSVGELLSGLYSILFGDLSAHDKKISGEELCAYTLQYIRENYAQALDIQSVCSKIGFSQTYLSRLLRKYADTTVNTYLTQCRIDAAKDMLQQNPNMLLRDIAAAVGYKDQSYFNKIFRNKTGMTPKQYVAQYQNKN